jgi:hypothetical protein
VFHALQVGQGPVGNYSAKAANLLNGRLSAFAILRPPALRKEDRGSALRFCTAK